MLGHIASRRSSWKNELLRISLIADKGADMFELVHKPSDTDFMWRTPWSVRNQALWVPSTGWGEGIFHDLYIGGWNTIAPTGGFQQDYMGAEIGQHNETNMMPWDAEIVEDSPERVKVKFSVRAVRTPFWIEKTVSLESNSPVVTVTDTLINEAEEPAPAQWGQHLALGDPFLTPDCILDFAGGDFIVPESPDGSVLPGSRLMPARTGSWPVAEAPDGSEVDPPGVFRRSPIDLRLPLINNLAMGVAVTNPTRGVASVCGGTAMYSKSLVLASLRWPQRLPVVQADLQRRIGTVYKFAKRDGGAWKRRIDFDDL